MNQLTNDILAFLFSKRYMDFKTCSGLRLVSAQFNFHASKYFRSLREFDLSILEENFDCDSEIVETPYACLLETVTKYCDKLEKIGGIRVGSDTLVSVSRICLQKLPSLTNIGIMDDAVDASVHFNLLKLLPNLRSVTFLDVHNDWDEDNDDVPPEAEKLFVSELSLYCGDFWRIFRVDHLKKLAILICVYESEEDVNRFCGVLERCQRLEQLELEVMARNTEFFQPVVRVAESLPHLKQFNLNLCTSSTEDVARIARQYQCLGKYTKKARIILSEPAGD